MSKQSIHIFRFVGFIAFLIILAMVLKSCEERFYPEIDAKYDELLVVDGMITNQAGPYVIKLSVSNSVGSPAYVSLSGYQINIEDNVGNSERLQETEIGSYTTAQDGIQGVVGRAYRISLYSPTGKKYQSDFEILQNPVGVDSLYAKVEYTPIEDYPYDLPGYQFYVSTAASEKDSTWFLWNLEHTWQYQSDFKIYFRYDGILHTVYETDTFQTCWQSASIKKLFLMSTVSLSQPQIQNFPLHFVRTDNRQLSIRYSLLAAQYRISKDAYQFWESIRNQNSEGGNLYSQQPFQVRGNVYNPENPDEPVFGYFMSAGITQKRIFVDKPKAPVKMYYSKCELTQVDYENYGWMFIGPPPTPDDPLYVTTGNSGGRALPHQACLNCTLKGGSLEKPDFWIDN